MHSYSDLSFTINHNTCFIPASNYHLFSDINISQGSVATRLRCGGIFSYHFPANLSLSLTTKEFLQRAAMLALQALYSLY